MPDTRGNQVDSRQEGLRPQGGLVPGLSMSNLGCGAFLVALLACLAIGCASKPRSSSKRIIVLGVDGLDPDMVRERMAELPHLARLASEGLLTDLGTSWPPQSPVAWTNFATGVNPGKHGLFDFIQLDRKNYGLLTSMTKTEPPWLDKRLFNCIPITLGGGMERTRAFPAFWDVMADAGFPVAIYRIPADFPVESKSNALVFPDMGTPDLTGAASGSISLWFERSDETDRLGLSSRSGSSYEMVPIAVNRLRQEAGEGPATAHGKLKGPPDGDEPSTIPVSFYLDQAKGSAALAVEINDQVAIAPLHDWSRFIPVTFKLSCGIDSVSGYVRFYLLSASPFIVYASPVQIDPWNPAMSVSSPPDASAELADAIGPYYTQGFPDAYKAYKVGALTTSAFLSESDTVFAERMRMMEAAFKRFDKMGGLLFFYTGALDLRCHMLWYHMDPDHPHREPAGTYDELPAEYRLEAEKLGVTTQESSRYRDQIDRIYRQVDALVGLFMARIEQKWPDAEFLVLSDHGFAPMRRVMNVNDWLVKEGYLVLKKPGANGSIAAPDTDGAPDFAKSIVDWEKTRAFSIGFNGITLNRKGREPRGIVTEAEAGALLAGMQAKLLAMRDEDGTPVLTKVLPAKDVYDGPETRNAPDLLLGFNVGYGASDPSAEGDITGEPSLVDNDSRWSGSHLMDPDLVKGSLLLRRNHKLLHENPGLVDVTATLYRLAGVAPPHGLDGKALFR